jgi:hypothetical protein
MALEHPDKAAANPTTQHLDITRIGSIPSARPEVAATKAMSHFPEYAQLGMSDAGTLDPARFDSQVSRFGQGLSESSKKTLSSALDAAANGDIVGVARSLIPANGVADTATQHAFQLAMKEAGVAVKFDGQSMVMTPVADDVGMKLTLAGDHQTMISQSVQVGNGALTDLRPLAGQDAIKAQGTVVDHVHSQVERMIYAPQKDGSAGHHR